MWPISARTNTSRTRSPYHGLCVAALGFFIALFAVPNPAAWAADKRDTSAQQSPIQIQQRIPAQNTVNQRDLIKKGKTPLVSPKDDLKTRVGKLTKLLSHPDPNVRTDAAKALGRIGPEAKDAVPTLSSALKDPDEKIRGVAKEAKSYRCFNVCFRN